MSKVYRIHGARFLRKYTAAEKSSNYAYMADVRKIANTLCKVPWERVSGDVAATTTIHTEEGLDWNEPERERFDAAEWCGEHADGYHRAFAQSACYVFKLPPAAIGKTLEKIRVNVTSDPYNPYGARIAAMTSATLNIPMDCETVRTGEMHRAPDDDGLGAAPRLYVRDAKTGKETWYSNNEIVEMTPDSAVTTKQFLFVFVCLENYNRGRDGWIEGSSYIDNDVEITLSAAASDLVEDEINDCSAVVDPVYFNVTKGGVMQSLKSASAGMFGITLMKNGDELNADKIARRMSLYNGMISNGGFSSSGSTSAEIGFMTASTTNNYWIPRSATYGNADDVRKWTTRRIVWSNNKNAFSPTSSLPGIWVFDGKTASGSRIGLRYVDGCDALISDINGYGIRKCWLANGNRKFGNLSSQDDSEFRIFVYTGRGTVYEVTVYKSGYQVQGCGVVSVPEYPIGVTPFGDCVYVSNGYIKFHGMVDMLSNPTPLPVNGIVNAVNFIYSPLNTYFNQTHGLESPQYERVRMNIPLKMVISGQLNSVGSTQCQNCAIAEWNGTAWVVTKPSFDNSIYPNTYEDFEVAPRYAVWNGDTLSDEKGYIVFGRFSELNHVKCNGYASINSSGDLERYELEVDGDDVGFVRAGAASGVGVFLSAGVVSSSIAVDASEIVTGVTAAESCIGLRELYARFYSGGLTEFVSADKYRKGVGFVVASEPKTLAVIQDGGSVVDTQIPTWKMSLSSLIVPFSVPVDFKARRINLDWSAWDGSHTTGAKVNVWIKRGAVVSEYPTETLRKHEVYDATSKEVDGWELVGTIDVGSETSASFDLASPLDGFHASILLTAFVSMDRLNPSATQVMPQGVSTEFDTDAITHEYDNDDMLLVPEITLVG